MTNAATTEATDKTYMHARTNRNTHRQKHKEHTHANTEIKYKTSKKKIIKFI